MIEDELFYGTFSFFSYMISFVISLISMVYIDFYVTLWVFLMTFIVIKLPSILAAKLERETLNMSKVNTVSIYSVKDLLYSYSFSKNKKVRKPIIDKTFNVLEIQMHQKNKLSKLKN